MTENNRRRPPLPQTAPPVSPHNPPPGNNPNSTLLPATTSPPTPSFTPRTHLMTIEDIAESVGYLSYITEKPERLGDEQDDVMKHIRQLALASIGNTGYQVIFKTVTDKMLDKGGKVGRQIIEKVEERTDESSFVARNELVSATKKAGIFGEDDSAFISNYKTLGHIVKTSLQNHTEKSRQDHEAGMGNFITESLDILSGKKAPTIIKVLTKEEKIKYTTIEKMTP